MLENVALQVAEFCSKKVETQLCFVQCRLQQKCEKASITLNKHLATSVATALRDKLLKQIAQFAVRTYHCTPCLPQDLPNHIFNSHVVMYNIKA